MKGVNKKQFKNPMLRYQHVLNNKENFRACNQGIRAKDQSMATYKQEHLDLLLSEKKSVRRWMFYHTLRAMKVDFASFIIFDMYFI